MAVENTMENQKVQGFYPETNMGSYEVESAEIMGMPSSNASSASASPEDISPLGQISGIAAWEGSDSLMEGLFGNFSMYPNMPVQPAGPTSAGEFGQSLFPELLSDDMVYDEYFRYNGIYLF